MKSCSTCGHYENMHWKCTSCGKRVHGGEWFECPHGKAGPSKGFEPYLDKHITDEPVWISTPGDRKRYLKPRWKDDYIVHTQERD